MRVVLADPPAYTPWYDHELAAALARAGADVELATSHFRFAELPPAERIPPRRAVLPALLAPLPPLARPAAAEGGRAPRRRRARSRASEADVLHVQWLALPQIDVNISFRSPSVFTAHDLLPTPDGRQARRSGSGSCGKFDRVVVHTAHGRESLAELGIEPVVISHPVYPSAAVRADDGQTLLALGVIRPYKGLPDAIEVVRRLPDARLLVAGDPAMALGGLRDAPRTEWRLGYLTQAELDRALSDATVALFPYRAELDQSGALLQALGAGVPAVVYDVGGLAEPVAPLRGRTRRSRRRRRGADRGGARAARRPGRARGRARRRRAGARRADLGGGGRAPSRAVPRSSR